MSPSRSEGRPGKSQRGQVLIVVAVAITVLFLFVGLAVDVGFWYGERRKMQNAADAGALAGAYEICHGDPTQYADSARDYAERNGADEVTVLRVNLDGSADEDAGTTVVVSATVTAQTFFSRLVLPNVRVSAVGAAACGSAEGGCGALPIAFDEPTYNNSTLLPCSEYDAASGKFTTYTVGSTFILWGEDNASTSLNALCDRCMCGGASNYLYNYITSHFDDTTTVISGTTSHPWGTWKTLPDQPQFIIGGQPMQPGNRGWLQLGLDDAPLGPEAGGDNACNNTSNCGSAINCWIKYGFPGQIRLSDPPMCLLGQPGVKDSVLETAKARIEGTISSFVLYNGWCGNTDPITFNCSSGSGGTKFKVAGLGCGLVLHVFSDKNTDGITMPNSPGYTCSKNGNPPPKCPTCPKMQRGIMVTKVCDCPATTCTGTTGEPVDPSTPRAASLVAVPANLTWPTSP